MRGFIQAAIVAAFSFGGVYVATAPDRGASGAKFASGSFGGAGCNVKGNISINSGERIYHVPGQRYYAETIIRQEYGERYFCSEQDARAAGWRRSGV